MTLTPVETVALASLLLLAGYWLRGRIAVLDRLNMPAPVIGGSPPPYCFSCCAGPACRRSGSTPSPSNP